MGREGGRDGGRKGVRKKHRKREEMQKWRKEEDEKKGGDGSSAGPNHEAYAT